MQRYSFLTGIEIPFEGNPDQQGWGWNTENWNFQKTFS